MLDAFIIEEIKRRDRGRSLEDRPAIELPLPEDPQPAEHDEGHGDHDRGVVIIDYTN
jgi:hypothetical protein